MPKKSFEGDNGEKNNFEDQNHKQKYFEAKHFKRDMKIIYDLKNAKSSR